MTRSAPVLVTGGAGYIGSHVVLALADAGWPAVVLDDLSTGRADALAAVRDGVELVVGDVGDPDLLTALLARVRPRAVLHFAGSIRVEESVAAPLAYYRNNTANSLTLLQACVAHGVEAFIFSSTAAVYGQPASVPVAEDAPTRPLNAYGHSKLMTEQMLRDAGRAHGLRHVILRYFNVAGADPDGRSGLTTIGATHLIKVACAAALRGHEIAIYGDDYPTRDGTCVRDFIHVSDLAGAHLDALDYLLAGGCSATLNCGYGRGYSVREVLATVARLSDRPLRPRIAPRRPGDAAEVVAAAGRIRAVLGWQPRHDRLDDILRDALAFERQLQGGR